MASNHIFDMGAYTYSQGIKAIGLMYEAAKNSLLQQRSDLDKSIEQYQSFLDEGGEPIGEWEDGNLLWDQESNYRLEQLTIDDSIIELRAATIITLYHHWEKSIPNDSESPNRRHPKLHKDATKHGINMHHDINSLWYTANYLKHGNDSWRLKLIENWPERWVDGSNGMHQPAWIRRLSLSDDDIRWFLEIADTSKRPISKFEKYQPSEETR
ncbi:MAG: hypothetical protein GW850_13960 [Sphingomonadales bacterium]|nr:hypothetical protein [Sphingomonadales bacterium]